MHPSYNAVPPPSNLYEMSYSSLDSTRGIRPSQRGQYHEDDDRRIVASDRPTRRRSRHERRLNFNATGSDNGDGCSGGPVLTACKGESSSKSEGGPKGLQVRTEDLSSTESGSAEENVSGPSPSNMPLPSANLIPTQAAISSSSSSVVAPSTAADVMAVPSSRVSAEAAAAGINKPSFWQKSGAVVQSPVSAKAAKHEKPRTKGMGSSPFSSPPHSDARGGADFQKQSNKIVKASPINLPLKPDDMKTGFSSAGDLTASMNGSMNGSRRSTGKKRGGGNGNGGAKQGPSQMGTMFGAVAQPRYQQGNSLDMASASFQSARNGSSLKSATTNQGSLERSPPSPTSSRLKPIPGEFTSPVSMAAKTGSPLRKGSGPITAYSGSPDYGVNKGKQPKGRMRFPDYWSVLQVNDGLKRGVIYKSVFRVNAHNRTEAYVTLDGISVDAMIDGLVAQNRAMEGDVVAVKLNPVREWVRLKGCRESKEDPVDSFSSPWVPDDSTGGSGAGVDVETEMDIGFVEEEFEDPDAAVERDGIVISTYDWQENGGDVATLNEALRTLVLSPRTFGKPDDGKVGKDIEAKLQLWQGGAVRNQLDTPVGSPDMRKGEVNGMMGGQGFSDFATAAGRSLQGVGGVALQGDERDLMDLAVLLKANPTKRPTGTVVGILEKSARRETVVGYLELTKEKNGGGVGNGQEVVEAMHTEKALLLVPTDSRFPKMIVYVSGLPDNIRQRLRDGDPSLAQTLVAARVDGWRPSSYCPHAVVASSLGQAGEIEAETAGIMFEYSIHPVDFPSSALKCLPKTPFEIPRKELRNRLDLRHCRIFSIDPPTARDLDDALSVKTLANGNLEIGVHIADVSYFVKPDTTLDAEAQRRSTSVYLIQRVLPMLPTLLCEELCSLNPGKERLAFSVVWVMTPRGEIVSQWMGKTCIRSCCKLTYPQAQQMIDGEFTTGSNEEVDDNRGVGGGGFCGEEASVKAALPQLHGRHVWSDIVADVRKLNGVALNLRDKRFANGALKLGRTKLAFVLDEDGNPTKVGPYELMAANFLVEEFMLLANMSVATTIARAFPNCALLRRHPPPNVRKLAELEELCKGRGYDFNSSCAGAIHESLQRIREQVDDPVVFDYLQFAATKPMQLAKYFCTDELRDCRDMWGHYALAVPMYTHFTSPIRRYPDIIVHRTLAAALEVEELLQLKTGGAGGAELQTNMSAMPTELQGRRSRSVFDNDRSTVRCFSTLEGDEMVGGCSETQGLMADVAKAHKVPSPTKMRDVACWCNERKQASKSAQEASDKIYLCVTLKKKQGILSDARVVSLGPRFMGVFITKFGIERRIFYEDIEGVKAEWFPGTGTLILDLYSEDAKPQRYTKPGRGGHRKGFSDIATLINPADTKPRSSGLLDSEDSDGVVAVEGSEDVEGAVLPLTLTMFSAVPVAVHAIQERNRPMDIGVRLYISSYMAGSAFSDMDDLPAQ